jgi:hypothetical protein
VSGASIARTNVVCKALGAHACWRQAETRMRHYKPRCCQRSYVSKLTQPLPWQRSQTDDGVE